MRRILLMLVFLLSMSMVYAANCSNREGIASSCTCNGATVSSGYCCYYDPSAGNITWQSSTCGYTKWSPHWEHIKLFIVHYTTDQTPEVAQWVAENFDVLIGGGNLRQYNPTMEWTGYIDLIGPTYITWFSQIRDLALSKGLRFEEGITHVLTDTIYAGYSPVKNPEAFDAFEATNPAYGYAGSNGVIVQHGTVYTDESNDAYSAAGNDVSFCQSANDYLYIGYFDPFDEINYIGSGSFTSQFEYYDGATWKVLALATDTTNGFRQSGQVRFVPPADWDIASVNGNRAKFFVRVHCLTVSTQPTASRIYGNDYYSGNAGEYTNNGARYNFKLRGFDVSNPGVQLVTKQNIKYNANPPATATARFQYWSRVPFSLGYSMNIGLNQSSSKLMVWVEGMANLTVDQIQKNNLTGMMWDDAQQNPATYSGISLSNMDYGEGDGESELRNTLIYNKVKQVLPAVYIGQNNYRVEYLNLTDFQLRENIVGDTNNMNANLEYYVYQYQKFLGYGSTITGGYDNYNWNTTEGLMFWAENALAATDHADRGPMNALAGHYVGINNYTFFGYHSHGNGNYGYETKGVKCTDGYQNNLAFDCTGHGTILQYNSWYPAIAVTIGQPLGKRYVWQSPGGAAIYRRNFTNGIALIRGGSYGSVFSPSYTLGGTYYRLYANGSLSAPITTIALREAEGAVLIANTSTPLCSLPYDSNPCNCISGGELGNAINGWYGDAINIPQLMNVIKQWKVCSS